MRLCVWTASTRRANADRSGAFLGRPITISMTHGKSPAGERGVIPGCRSPGPDSHMAVDGLGRPWLEVGKLPSTIDAWLAALREETRRSRIARGADPETGLKVVVALRSDLTPEQRAEAVQIGRIGFASAGARRKAA